MRAVRAWLGMVQLDCVRPASIGGLQRAILNVADRAGTIDTGPGVSCYLPPFLLSA